MTLTVLAIKHLKPKDKLYRVTDSEGLQLEVPTSGGKLWRYRFLYNGKPQMMSLGKFPEVSLQEARQKRDEARALLKAGKHPVRERRAKKLRNIAGGENTFENVARYWHEQRGQSLNQKYHKQCLVRLEQHIFPKLGALPIHEITIPDVVRVVEAIGKTGTVPLAHWAKQAIGQVFRFAAMRGMCQFNPAADIRGVLPKREKKHHACIRPAELPQLLRAMKDYSGDDQTYAALHLLALTFVRTGELIGAKWEEIDFGREEWHIPKERMKMRRPHVVPLSRQSLAILKTLHAKTGHRPNVFHSQRGSLKHISNGCVLMALRRMGYHGRMTGHGFRALASTILNEKGYPPDVIERQLAHEDEDKIRSAYNRAEYLLERKKMMQDYADYLDSLLTEPDNLAQPNFTRKHEQKTGK